MEKQKQKKEELDIYIEDYYLRIKGRADYIRDFFKKMDKKSKEKEE